MTNNNIGKFIVQRRKEQEMTQQQLADQLHVSNKTISKWECGLGSPDVSLWDGLSLVLGIDVATLIQGEGKPNPPAIGNMTRTKFYVCQTCGNGFAGTSQASISCCGRKLRPLIAILNPVDHPMSIETIDLEYYISLDHDMQKDHYISFVAHVNQEYVHFHRLYPQQTAELRIPRMGRHGILYVYCTKHGLFQYSFVPSK